MQSMMEMGPYMPQVGDRLLRKYTLKKPLHDAASMSELWLATSHDGSRFAVKFCTQQGESHTRFLREARLMTKYDDSDYVVKLVDIDLEADPPFFVMPMHDKGNLLTLGKDIRQSMELQEQVFTRMVECVAELHANNHIHRDIKPENFLRDGSRILIADFGLGVELSSGTRFTSTTHVCGTLGYIPPEYARGGFKEATPASDIFMLGKSFYRLLTDRDPQFLDSEGVDEALYLIIERCCHHAPERRYNSTSELLQALGNVFDILLGRVQGMSKAEALLEEIEGRLESEDKYKSESIRLLVQTILALPEDEQMDAIMQQVRPRLVRVLSQPQLADVFPGFLRAYGEMVRREKYGWAFAETAADCMATAFHENVPAELQFEAFSIAVHAATSQNRFAAMDTCKDLMQAVESNGLAIRICELLGRERPSFLIEVQPSTCRSTVIRDKLWELRSTKK